MPPEEFKGPSEQKGLMEQPAVIAREFTEEQIK